MSFRIHEAPAPINLHHLIIKPKRVEPIIVEAETIVEAVKPEFTVFVHDVIYEKSDPNPTIPDVIKKEEVVMHIRRNRPAK